MPHLYLFDVEVEGVVNAVEEEGRGVPNDLKVHGVGHLNSTNLTQSSNGPM